MQEKELKLISGWPVLTAVLLAPIVGVLLIWLGAETQSPWPFVALGFLGLAWLISLPGFFVVNPNEAKVIQLFGKYVGTVKDVGFHYGSPFYWKQKISMRVQTFETGVSETPDTKDAAGKVLQTGSRHRRPSKVNDRDGTPIEIAAVVVYKVVNTAHALFQVSNYEDFVHIQSDSALRSMAGQYSYDSQDDAAHSLRGQTAEVAERLKHEIQERIKIAGIEIIEARISYLAYASEIASAMLQRQQATALIAARQKIVEGAVGMVEHALEMLAEKKVLDLDPDRKAAMVSNLLVVLCGHQNPQPVLNTGTIYQ